VPKLSVCQTNHDNMAERFICSSCGSLSAAKVVNKGSGAVELVLWFFFIVPGLIYSVWRRSGRPKVCSVCRQNALVPLNSPVGQKMLHEHQGKTLNQVQEEIAKEPYQMSNFLKFWIIIAGVFAVVYLGAKYLIQ